MRFHDVEHTRSKDQEGSWVSIFHVSTQLWKRLQIKSSTLHTKQIKRRRHIERGPIDGPTDDLQLPVYGTQLTRNENNKILTTLYCQA